MSETERAKPQPAAGHIYRTTAGHLLTLGEEAPTSPGFFRVSDGWMRAAYYIETGAWTLAGISTPAGRVMVGERRAQPGLETMTRGVLTILDDEDVRMGWPDGPESGVYFAADVAAWPLLPATVPLAPAARGACLDRYEEVKSAVRPPVAFDRITIGGVEIPCRAIIGEPAAEPESLGKTSGAWSGEGTIMWPRTPAPMRWALGVALASREAGPGIAALSLPPARVAVEVEELPERWARWGLP